MKALFLAFFGLLVGVAAMSADGETNALSNMPLTNRFAWTLKDIQRKTDTNGLIFSLEMKDLDGYPIRNRCGVYVSNQSSNKIYLCILYQASWLKVELLDSGGQSVEKTEIGKQFGQPIDMAQLREMIQSRYRQWVSGRARTTGFRPFVANSILFPLADFNPSELFNLKQSGEYTLHIQIPVIQRVGQDKSNPEFKIIWLPEVIAKVQIREAGISEVGKP